jgi:CRISPR-associated protein Cas2
MVVLIVERAKPSLRGELSRWLIEPRAGVFVGNISAMVRDKLWEKVTKSSPDGGAMMIHNALTEQGFCARIHGDTSRTLVDLEGLLLVRVPQKRESLAQEGGTPAGV